MPTPAVDTMSGASQPVLVHARHVRRGYGDTPVLDDVSFDIAEGITGLLGANGAGKTTMLGMILGLHRVDAGTLLVYGLDPWTAGADVRALTGYAPEHHTLPPDLRADEFVRHVAELHGLPRDEATTRASDALWLVGLGEERFRPMGTMSTGQRQRVKLAQAIAHDPRLILLDEPTDGLDPVQRDAMLDLIATISRDFGINVVLSSHLLDEVERICDGVVIVGEGRTLAAGPLDQLRGEGQTGVTVVTDASPEATEALAAALRAQGFEAAADGRNLTVTGASESGDSAVVDSAVVDSAVFDAVRDACADHEVGIVRLSRRRLTLEDVFLDRLG